MLKVCHVCGLEKDFGRSNATTCRECIAAGLKWCSKCGNVKPLTAFSKSGNGYMNLCKTCHNARNKEWRHTEQGNRVANETNRRYRARPDAKQKHAIRNQLHKASGTLTGEQWYSTCEAFNFQCAYCGSVTHLTMDHVTPVSHGGRTSVDNIIPACQTCNSSKGSKDVIQWYTSQPFYDKNRLDNIFKFIKKGSDAE